MYGTVWWNSYTVVLITSMLGECPELLPYSLKSWVHDFYGHSKVPEVAVCCVEGCPSTQQNVPIKVVLVTLLKVEFESNVNPMNQQNLYSAPVCIKCYRKSTCGIGLKHGFRLRSVKEK